MRRGLTVVVAIGVAVAGVTLLARVREAREREPVTLPAAQTAWARPLGAAVTLGPLRSDGAYRRALGETFSSLTPENEMKWERLEPRRGAYDFADADALVATAGRDGRRVRGHPLVWDQQLPAWLTARRWRAAELEAVVAAHVRRVVSRYRGRVAVWDVVNEPFEDDGSWTPSVFHRVLGERFVAVAFRAARRADPRARLFLNEIAAEHEGPKARALERLVVGLKRSGVPIDGVGLQNHTTDRGFPDRARLEEVMRRYARHGLDVEITEMDVALPAGAPPAAAVPAYRAAAEACASAANCAGLTVWGVTDRHSWLGAAKRPLLFDGGGRPKPAYGAVRAALGR